MTDNFFADARTVSKRTRVGGGVGGKRSVLALVERDCKVANRRVANATHKEMRPLIFSKFDRASNLMSDEARVYERIDREFALHAGLNYGIGEYVSHDTLHTNTIENSFSIFKRGVIGTYHHMSEARRSRYCVKFDFRYNTRKPTDADRTDEALLSIRGKRLTYRWPILAA